MLLNLMKYSIEKRKKTKENVKRGEEGEGPLKTADINIFIMNIMKLG